MPSDRQHAALVRKYQRLVALRKRLRKLRQEFNDVEEEMINRLADLPSSELILPDGRVVVIHDNFREDRFRHRNTTFVTTEVKHREIGYRKSRRSHVIHLGGD